MTLPIIQSPWLRKLLAIEHFQSLHGAFLANSKTPLSPISWRLICFALFIAAIPALAHVFPPSETFIGVPTIVTGLAVCLAIVLRNHAKLAFLGVTDWRRTMRLTHTAFAVGCIPIAIVLMISPESASDIPYQATSSEKASALDTLKFILHVALWAALTEEFIYRGLLLSFLRRINFSSSQFKKDIFAIIASSLLFGIAHIPSWGIALSIGVSGLGIGFGIAFIAVGERLLPLIVYHAIFDILSLFVTLWL